MDRGRDTSNELTEVRTVLSRAETALNRLFNLPDEGAFWNHKTCSYEKRWVRDPDREEMIDALSRVCDELVQWTRTGRAKR